MTNIKSLPEYVKGSRVSLQKNELSMADEIFALVEKNRKYLSEYMPWPEKNVSIQDSINWIKICQESWKQKAMFDFGIYLNKSNKYIGNMGIHSIEWRHSRCELGYWIGEEYEKQGYISEALQLLEKACFEAGFHRIEIRCSSVNLKSAKVPTRNGYKLEAYLTDEVIEKGKFRNTLVFAKIKNTQSANSINLIGLDMVYLFVSNIESSKNWYEKVLNVKPHVDLTDFAEFRIGASGLCLHLADSKSPLSTGGSVGYWRVLSLEKSIKIFLENGAHVYRGPLALPTSEKICQLKDPFGNIIGLIG